MWFAEQPLPASIPELLAAAPGERLRVLWLGQAGFVIDGAGKRVVIDPYLSDSLAEKYRGTKFEHRRLMPAPVAPEAIAHVDLVMATHHHTDHLDPGTFPALMAANENAHLVAPAAAMQVALSRAGISSERLLTMDAGQTVSAAGIEITATRAAHETLERDGNGQYRFLGLMIRVGDARIFHSGDTIPFPGQVEEVASLKADLALLPVNGRDAERSGNGVPGNMSVDEAIALARGANIPQVIAHHFDMFDFNTVPRVDVEEAARRAVSPMVMAACAHRIYLAYSSQQDASRKEADA
ncbi:MAG TPA: MBL fold metallo-hydrolase [Pararhizobium sp.]|nr:MBL fold metallo-hydrolase [Pararhizobium sp.]